MKKFFTFAAALMASVAMMAVEPTLETSEWGADDFSTVIANHDGIALSTHATAWSGNFSGIQYIALGGGTDMSAASPTPYFAISATNQIDSIEVYWAPNGTSASNIAWIAWEDASDLLNQDVDFYGETAEFTGSKSIEGATTQIISFNEGVHAVLLGRQLKKVRYGGAVISNFGKNATVNILGIKVWVNGVAPTPTPVSDIIISGPTEAYVGEKVTLKATTDVKADTIWWTDQYGAMQVSSKGTFEFTPAAVGSFTYTAWAENANNTNPANQSHTVVVTEAPPVTSCTNLIPASTGDDPVVGDEIALNAVSEGGKIFVAGMKNATGDIKYTAYGLQIGGGGADSLRVELNNYLKEGSIITLKLAAGGTGSRGLNIQTLGKSTVYQAKWEPTAALEENTLSYTIPAGSPLIGASKFLLQRNNTVYLVSIEVANCGEPTGEAVIDDTPALAVAPATVTLAVTASNLNPSANITFSGKNLTPGTYNLTIPNLAGLTVTPTSVTVGEDGKLNAEVAISYESAVEVAAASTTIGLTIGELSESATINYSAVLAKNYMSSVNIEQLVVANGTGYNIQGALTAANIEYASINALDSLNDSKGAARNEAYLGMKFKTSGAYIAGWLQASKTLRVKFGNLPAAVKVTLNGAAAADHTTGIFEYTATEDTYVKLATSSSSTVVIKQIMVNEPITKVMYNIAYSVGEGGTVTGWTVAFPGEDVVMDITSNEGYALHNIAYNGTAMVQTAPGAPISFIMPAEDVTVTADFGDVATAINNTEATVKAVKRIVNGQLFIEKNGVLYNAQGATVK